jgi:hypothetical protein
MATALLGPLALGWIDYHVSAGAADPAPKRWHSPRRRTDCE